jgi:hypothetical protein
MGGPNSFKGPVCAISVPILISAAGAADTKAKKTIKTLAKITILFMFASFG